MRYLPLILLTGCTQLTQIDYSVRPPYDWPKLTERVVYLDLLATQNYCRMTPQMRKRGDFGCAQVNFREGTCTIYLSKQSAEALEHERAHCAGYDHVGDAGRSREAWERWKEHKRNGGV